MFIISPRWIYSHRKKLETEKALLIDGSLIKEIIDKNTIKKKYKDFKVIEYTDHILMPSLSESCIKVHDCIDENQLNIKLNRLLSNGVTKVNLSGVSEDMMKYTFNSHIQLGQMFELDGKIVEQSDIKNVTSLLDNFKSDPSKLLSISLKNINHFDDEVIKKISFITNEVSISLHINLNDIYHISHEKELKNKIKFWEDINLLNNSYLYTFPGFNEQWFRSIKKNNITLMISYKELKNIKNLKYLISLLDKKYKCILISNDCESYKFYQIINHIKLFTKNQMDSDIVCKIIECVTSNTSELFSNYLSSGTIKKGNQASFNLFNYKQNYFLDNYDINPDLYNLDKESLTHVWSSGKQVGTV
jgi:hypothetical protein